MASLETIIKLCLEQILPHNIRLFDNIIVLLILIFFVQSLIHLQNSRGANIMSVSTEFTYGVKTLGLWYTEAIHVFIILLRRLVKVTRDPRVGFYLV